MDTYNHSLSNQNSSSTGNEQEESLRGANSEGIEPSSSVSVGTSDTFMKDDKENDTGSASKMNLTEHQSRSRTRNGKLSDSLSAQTDKNRLPPLETQQQFLTALTKCARGGDSMERISPKAGRRVTREIPDLSPTVLDTIPIIIASSPTMKASVGKKNRAENRRTAAEIDAFFTRLSTPKYIKGKVSKDKKVEDRVQLMSAAQRRRYEATKGLSVNVVRTRSNSVVRSGSHSSSIGN